MLKYTEAEAKELISKLTEKCDRRWKETVDKTRFMDELKEGKLKKETIQLFYKNWGSFVPVINSIYTSAFYKHLWFFVKNVDLMEVYTQKVLDEFGHPSPPGHIQILIGTGKALGLTAEETLLSPMLPEARAILDFKRALLWEGTVAEWWFSMLTEEPIGHWAAAWFKALTTHYGFSRQQAVYFSTHEEADLKEHDEGVMGHGSFNRMVMQRILEDGYADVREGYSLEYCAIASVDLYGVMHRAAVELS